jgi:hypothetical protein
MYGIDVNMVNLKHECAMLPTVCKIGEPGGPREVTLMSTISDSFAALEPVAAAMMREVRTSVKIYLTVPVRTD